MLIRALAAAVVLVMVNGAASAATLGLVTSAPTIGATGTVDYLEFGPDGDLSLFGASVFGSSLTSLDVATAEIDFGIGFDLSAPEDDATGGFSVFDDQGLYLAGDLLALGTRGFRANDGIIELQFGSFEGRGVSEWTDTLLMNVIFSGTGSNAFESFFDGDYYDVEIGMFAVQGGPPTPAPVPLPAGIWMLLCGIGILWGTTRTASVR